MTGEPNQSSSLPLSSMICSAPTTDDQQAQADEVDRRARVGGLAACAACARRRSAQTAATGTLMKKTQGQPSVVADQPPRIGPGDRRDHRRSSPTAPCAWPRCSGGKTRISSVCDMRHDRAAAEALHDPEQHQQAQRAAPARTAPRQMPKPTMPATNTLHRAEPLRQPAGQRHA